MIKRNIHILFVFLALSSVGAFIFLSEYQRFSNQLRSVGFKSATAQIVSMERKRINSRFLFHTRGNPWVPVYKYEVGGKYYQSSRYSFSNGDWPSQFRKSSFGESDRSLVGQKILVYFNPLVPNEVVVNNLKPKIGNILIPLFAVCL